MPKRKNRSYEDDPNAPCEDWCFTLNNYTDDDLKLWERIFEDVRHGLVTKEIAPSTGTPHLQGRVVFRRGYRFSQLQKQGWADDWSKTKCRQDSLYMLKKDSVIFLDKKPHQGKRSDLEQCVQLAAEGASLRELYTKHPATMVRYSEGIRKAALALAPTERIGSYTLEQFPKWEPIKDWSKTIVLCGPPDSGKTEFALAHFKNAMVVSHIDALLDYDKDRHDGIVFDDMDFSNKERSLAINLTDNAIPRQIQCRYRAPTIPAGTKKIFTCNEWPFDVNDKAIKRRIRQMIAVNRETALQTETSV